MRTQAKRAFTLIEILIVVVILGILAAIVIPQFTDASQQAQDSSVRSQLQTLRAQIELFRVKNPNTTLDLINSGWTQMTSANPPYLQAAPKNPLQANATSVAGAAAANVGWVWRSRGNDAGGNPLPNDLYAVAADGTEFVE